MKRRISFKPKPKRIGASPHQWDDRCTYVSKQAVVEAIQKGLPDGAKTGPSYGEIIKCLFSVETVQERYCTNCQVTKENAGDSEYCLPDEQQQHQQQQ